MKKIFFCNLSGEIITPGDDKYEKLRQEWNRAIQKYPIAIVYCGNYCDVSNAVLWARKKCVPIRIRSGGHHYEGYSTGNSVLVIDVSRINKIQLNNSTNTVKVGSGVRNRELYNYISKEGYPFPGGTCPTVGISGYCLGGGWGYSSRLLGLGCDSLLEIELVDYKGDLLKVNEHVNPDLFWALKGAGGGNYGVVISMTFKLPKKVDRVTLFEIYYPNASKKTQVMFLDIWQKWIGSVDNNINMNGGIYNTLDDGIYIYARGICYENPEQAKTLLQPFYSIEGADISMEYLTFLQAINKVFETYPDFEYFKSTGRFVDRHYSLEEIESVISIVNGQRPSGSILTSVGIYGLGGEVSEVGKHDTAFYYRNSKYILSIQSVFKDNSYKEINNDWVAEKFEYIYGITNGSYVNFPFNKLCDYNFEYYGENVCRLKFIKEKYDPFNTFNFPQGIK